MKKISRAVLGAVLLAVAGLASAATTKVFVDSVDNSIVGGVAADALKLSAGESFSVIASGFWENDPAGGSYLSGPNGHSDQTFTTGGYTFDVGTLVGDIGGTFFKVGSSYSGVAAKTGELEFFYWDSDAANNSGTVKALVSTVPEPMNVALMALALGAFALTSRRKT